MTELHCVHGKQGKQLKLTLTGLLAQILHLLHIDLCIPSTQGHLMSLLCIFIL